MNMTVHLIYSNARTSESLPLVHFGRQSFLFCQDTCVLSNHYDYQIQEKARKQEGLLRVVHFEEFGGLVFLRLWGRDVIPGAEPAAEFAGRVRAAIERLAAAHPGQRVAAFTHGGVIGEALAQASESRPFAFNGADNASISRLVIVGDRWIVRGFNDTAHLDTPPRPG